MDTQLLENQISGLESRRKELDAAKDLFTKAQGLHEEAEKAGAEHAEKALDLQAVKEEISDLRAKKRAALQPVAEALSAKMSEVMPEGKALLEISDDGVWIGWERPDGVRIPYLGLSGGQKIAFDQALAYALLGEGNKILILEAAEADPIRLQALLFHLVHTPADTQIILNTWLTPAEVPKEWKVTVIS